MLNMLKSMIKRFFGSVSSQYLYVYQYIMYEAVLSTQQYEKLSMVFMHSV